MALIQMYTTRWCGYCVRAKTLLDSRRLPYEEISLDDDPAFRQTVFDATGGWTVPQILVDGQPVVAERRSLTGEAVLERCADASVEPPQLVPVEPGCWPERI